jgi:hypothetical protein
LVLHHKPDVRSRRGRRLLEAFSNYLRAADCEPAHDIWLVPAVSFDYLIGAGEERRRDVEAKRPRGLQVSDEFERGRLLDRQVGGLGAARDAVDNFGGASITSR